MTAPKSPPIYEPLIEGGTKSGDDDSGGVASLPWILFFNSIFNGDTGTSWTPSFTSLTQVGVPTITGKYYRIGRTLAYFSVRIVPGTSTTSVAGTTFINNFPLALAADGACLAVSGLLGGNAGMCDKSSNAIYPPAWTSVTVPLTIVGLVEAG